MNILVLAAGTGSVEGSIEPYPIWLSEIDGQLLLERQVKQLSNLDCPRFIFAFRSKEIEAFHLREIVNQMSPGCSVIEVKRETAGAACTALLAVAHVDMNDELVVVSATDHHALQYSSVIKSFRDRHADAGLLTFDSLHPRYSYVRLSEDGWVMEVAEKRPISRSANAGFYWFARAEDCFNSIRRMIMKDAQVQGRFYISPSLNELILRKKKVDARRIEIDQYHPLKSERQFEAFEHAVSDWKGCD
jgi:bifunctional N-acetylglucosamine-1-phosphate-uridyltransferase/glucosamine-1-phosphate-acetyltransferase GlmU-like protein